ncbi:hypothetical protein HDU86_003251 [Geranomyces michiganensis]|nr:hypothetical protein HDU86_003251 [Geranomyces michiganensis]
MSDFAPKVAPVDWDFILQFDIDALLAQQAAEEIDSKLEALYDMLVDARVRPEGWLHEHRKACFSAILRWSNMAPEAKVQEQDDEMAGLVSGGDAPYVTELQTLREDNEDLEKRNDALTNHLAEAEELLSAERTTVRELNAQLTADRERATAAEEIVSRMKAEIKDYQSQLQNRKDRIQMKNLDDDQIRKQLREKNGELARYVAEVELLSAENARLTAEVEALTQEVEVTVNELERKDREAKETEQVVLHHDMTIDQLNAEKIALRTKLEDLTRQVETAGSQDEKFLSELQAEVHHYERAIHECEAASALKDVTIEQLRTDVAKMQEELRLSNLGAVHKQLIEKDEQIADLQTKLGNAHRDFELLSLDWDKIDKMLQSQSGVDVDALRGQLHSVNKLKDKLDAYRARHRKTLSKIHAADTQLEYKESELLALQARIEKYENSVYGLPDAAREIKTLELRLRAKDKELLARSQQINAVEDQLGKLFDENAELRVRLGSGEKSVVDVSKIRNVLSVELQRSQALNAELRSEIDRLEEERLHLKASMRLHAIERGERAVALGMTVNDLAKVEDFAERLRLKNGSRPFRKRSGTHDSYTAPTVDTKQLEKLVVELERAQVDAAEARSEAKRLQNDKCRLEAAIKEVSLTLVQMRDNYGDRLRDGSSFQFPAVQKLLSLMDKNHKLSKEGNLNGLDAGKHILLVNKMLRDEVKSAKAATENAISELAAHREQLEQMQADRDKWKRIVENPPARATVDFPASLAMVNQADYAALLEKLADCLEQSRAKDTAIQAGREALKKYQGLYSMLAGQQRELYGDFQALKTDSEAKISSLTQQLAEAIAASQDAGVRVKGLEQTVHDLSLPADDLKATLVGTQRANFLMKVNEKALTRRYQALQSMEDGLRRDLVRLQGSFSQLEKSSKERITHLEVLRRSANSKIDQLQSRLADSVPAAEHAQLENRMQLYIAKTTHLLEKEQDWLEARLRSQPERDDPHILRKRVESLEGDLHEARIKAARMEETCRKLTGTQKGDDSTPTHVCSLQHQISSLEVQVELLQNRTDIAEKKCAAMADGEAEVERRMAIMDKVYTEVKEENFKLREAELELRNTYAGGLCREDAERQIRRIAELESQVDQMTQDVAHYKDQCATASLQAADLLSMRDADEKEKRILRAALEELQMEGDDKLLIGKLHQQILDLQISEARSARKESELHEKCLSFEGTILKLEKDIDERDARIFQLRMEHKRRALMLHKSVSQLRARLAGTVTPDKYERACKSLVDVHSQKHDLKERLETLLTEKIALEEKLSETTEKARSLEELVDALNSCDASVKLVSWHQKMSVLQLAELRLQRELAREREETLSAKRESTELSARLHALEEDFVSLQSEADARQIEWEQYEQELESGLSLDPEHISNRTTTMDRSLPIGQQLEQALRQLVERDAKITTLEDTVQTLETKARENEDELHRSKADVTSLQLKLHETHLPKTLPEQTEATNQLDPPVPRDGPYRQREADAIRVAKATITSMKNQLTAKDALVEKYRTMWTTVRAEMEAHQNDAALQERTAQLDNLNDREVERLRKPHFASEADVGVKGSANDAVVELTSLVAAKDIELEGLQNRINDVLFKARAEKDEMQSQIADLRSRLDEKQAEIQDISVKMEALKAEIDEAHRQAAEPPRNEELVLIAKLRQDLNAKDVSQAKLVRALQDVKQSVIENAESSARRDIVAQNDRGDLALSHQIAKLEAKLQSAATRAAEERRAQEENSARHANEVKRLENALRDCRAKVKKLTEERDELKREAASARAAPTSRKSSSGDSNEPKSRPASALTLEQSDIRNKLQKRIGTLQNKLQEKTEEVDKLLKTLSTMRDTFHRTEREKTRLQHKVQSLSSQLASVQQLKCAQHADGESLAERNTDERMRPSTDLQIEVSGSTFSLSKLRNAELSLADHPASTLLAIVEHVARICERLRLENESLKKNGSTNTRYMEAVREIKRLKSEIAENQETRRAADQASRKSAIIEEENIKLQKQVRLQRERQLKVTAKASELEAANVALVQELEGFRKAVVGTTNDSRADADTLEQRVKDLTAELAERDRMVQNLLSPDQSEMARLGAEARKLKNEVEMWQSRSNKLTEELAAASAKLNRSPSPDGRESQWAAQKEQARRDVLALHKKLEAKEKQNQELQEELSAFDPAFFEELSDLKWNYSEAVRINVQYEDTIRDMSGKLGLDPKAYLASSNEAVDGGGYTSDE